MKVDHRGVLNLLGFFAHKLGDKERQLAGANLPPAVVEFLERVVKGLDDAEALLHYLAYHNDLEGVDAVSADTVQALIQGGYGRMFLRGVSIAVYTFPRWVHGAPEVTGEKWGYIAQSPSTYRWGIKELFDPPRPVERIPDWEEQVRGLAPEPDEFGRGWGVLSDPAAGWALIVRAGNKRGVQALFVDGLEGREFPPLWIQEEAERRLGCPMDSFGNKF